MNSLIDLMLPAGRSAVELSLFVLLPVMVVMLSLMRLLEAWGALDWLVARLTPLLRPLGLTGLGVFAMIRGAYLAMFFGFFVAFSATQMFLDKKPAPTRQLPGPTGQWAAGGAIGFLSGLVGAGGAFISVPFMTWCNVPVHNAVATSAALGFPIAIVNVVGYVIAGQGVAGLPTGSLGYVWLPALVVIASCSVLTAPLGARAAHALPVGKLKRLFACVLYALGGYMIWKGFTG